MAAHESLSPKLFKERIWWHGSPSGDLRGGNNSLHLGTHDAAKEALEARIGRPAEGSWDGSREYGSTMLVGSYGWNTETGERDTSADHLPDPTGRVVYSTGKKVKMTEKPRIDAFVITGDMVNHPGDPIEDEHANERMQRSVPKSEKKAGWYYTNESEDYGSVSAVVPDKRHLRRPKAITDAVTVMVGGKIGR